MAQAITETRGKILEVARRLIQARGFSAVSFADISAEVGIRKASIHHHFPTKADLAVALMQRYRTAFGAALAEIVRGHATCATRLDAYRALFGNVLRDGHRLCLCGMLAADFDALPETVRVEVRGFFDDNETWLAEVLAEGKRRHEIEFRGTATSQARVVLSAFEGAMLVARTYRDVRRFDAVTDQVLAGVLRDA